MDKYFGMDSFNRPAMECEYYHGGQETADAGFSMGLDSMMVSYTNNIRDRVKNDIDYIKKMDIDAERVVFPDGRNLVEVVGTMRLPRIPFSCLNRLKRANLKLVF